MNIPGENSINIMSSNEYLTRVNLMDAASEDSDTPVTFGKRVAVIGGGNTAMDACRTAVRLGAKEVYNIYRRTKDEMPADMVEIEEAEEEGVIFKNLTNPIEVIKDENGHAKEVVPAGYGTGRTGCFRQKKTNSSRRQDGNHRYRYYDPGDRTGC